VSPLIPLLVAVPLLAAPVLGGAGHMLPRRATDVTGIAVAAASVVLATLVLLRSVGGPLVYWFSGWRPRGDLALGISFTIDPIGAGLALLATILVLAALAYSWSYFEEVGPLFHALMLLFLGGMVGFALTGDIFNLFVFFELMSTAAFALCGYKIEEAGPMQGAFNFAVTNAVGAYFVLLGIGLLYGKTGALNLAQIGRAVAHDRPSGLLVAALTLITVGFLVKAAAVPFHFWLADAHAVAPAPVCVLFSGVMVELGLYAVARIYWTVFSGPFGGGANTFRDILIGLGIVTGAVGAVMAFLQRHIKRLLAYSTVAHMGVFIVGVALLTPDGLAGTAMYVLAHGLAKGSLFLLAGILLERARSVDELELHGVGRAFRFVGVTWLLAAVALTGVPFVGVWEGHALIGHAASTLDRGWLDPVLALFTAVSTGAVIRVGARVFLGWGPRDDELLSTQRDEGPEEESGDRPAWLLAVPAAVLAAGAIAVGAVAPLSTHAEQAAERFQNRTEYAARVLDDRAPESIPLPRHVTTSDSVLWGIVSALGAFGVGAFGLWRNRLPSALRHATWRALRAPTNTLRAAHSGHVGDYVAWLTTGAAVLGALFAFGLT
jgi:multicomponent Na+:H+ antiporter subunit D